MTTMTSASLALLTLGCLLALAPVRAEVDSSTPDLSRFNLRKVKPEQFAEKRASEPVTDLGVGAMALYEALYVDEMPVRCAAYAHLFRLIKHGAAVHQDTIVALTVVTEADTKFYIDLLAEDAYDESTSNFIAAVKALESRTTDAKSYSTWLELVRCSLTRMANGRMGEFLKQDTRRISSAYDFKSLTANRQRNEETNPHVPSDKSSQKYLDEARALIESLDDAETAKFRQQQQAHPFDGEAQPQEAAPVAVDDEDQDADDARPNPADALKEDLYVPELVYPPDTAVTGNGRKFSGPQLMLLQLIKMRLARIDSPTLGEEAGAPLAISQALDFMGNWQLLEAAALDRMTRVGASSIDFRSSSDNKKLAKRVRRALESYADMTHALAKLRELVNSKQVTELDQLRAPFERLRQTLATMDPAFNVANVRRATQQWQAKMDEYTRTDKFINDV